MTRRSRILFRALIALSIAPAVWAAAPGPESDTASDWTDWHNARFGYTLCYPKSLFPIGRESPQKHGIVLESADSAQMIAAGMIYTRKTLAEPIRMEKERLTHIALMSSSRDLTSGDTEFVIAGTRVDQILYTKAMRSGDRLIAIRFRYPQSLKARYAPIVERIAGCLRFSKKEG